MFLLNPASSTNLSFIAIRKSSFTISSTISSKVVDGVQFNFSFAKAGLPSKVYLY